MRLALAAAGAGLAGIDSARGLCPCGLVRAALAGLAAAGAHARARWPRLGGLRLPGRPRYLVRRAAGDADAQALRDALAPRRLQPARLFAVRALRRLPAGPGPADTVVEPAGGRDVADGLGDAAAGRDADATARASAQRVRGAARAAGGAGRLLAVPAPAHTAVGPAGELGRTHGPGRSHDAERMAGRAGRRQRGPARA